MSNVCICPINVLYVSSTSFVTKAKQNARQTKPMPKCSRILTRPNQRSPVCQRKNDRRSLSYTHLSYTHNADGQLQEKDARQYVSLSPAAAKSGTDESQLKVRELAFCGSTPAAMPAW